MRQGCLILHAPGPRRRFPVRGLTTFLLLLLLLHHHSTTRQIKTTRCQEKKLPGTLHPTATAPRSSDYNILPSMGSAFNTATAFPALCHCNLAASATPDSARAFGLSTTDASFAALLWCLLAGGPP